MSSLKRYWRTSGRGHLFILPWLLGFAIFTAYPFLRSVYLSFTAYDIVTPARWVGLANYQTLLTDDPLFYKSLIVTLRYALLSVPLSMVASLVLALLLSAEIRGQSVFRTIFYLPSIVPMVANAIVFNWLLNPQMGLFNRMLEWVGI